MVFTPQAACAQKISRRSASALRKLSSTRAKPPLDYNHNLQVADVLEKLPESVTDGRCVLPLCYGEALIELPSIAIWSRMGQNRITRGPAAGQRPCVVAIDLVTSIS